MQVKLIHRKTKNKGIGLSLFMNLGSERINGKIKHKRKMESLGLFLYENPQTNLEKKENEQKLRIANKLRAEREMQLLSGKYDIIMEGQKQQKKKKGICLIQYMEQLNCERKRKGLVTHGWHGAIKHLKIFCNNRNVHLDEVDKKFLIEYQNYLRTTTNTKGEKKLLQNSQCNYYGKLQITIRTAFDEEIINIDPCKKVEPIRPVQTERVYLTEEEIKKLATTNCRNAVLKRAYLFSCFTGLRWSDVHKLIWGEIVKENDTYKLIFKQKKTKSQEYFYLHQQALKLLGERGKDDERVFRRLNYSSDTSVALRQWAMDAGITKNISYHSSRHSFACWLLEKDVDIYTVSKLLGHSELKTTQIYAKIMDKKKLESINKLPNMDIKL